MANGSEVQSVDRNEGARQRDLTETSLPLHPFLFAIASVLALLAQNLGQTFISNAVPALVGSLAFAFVVYMAVVAVRRRFDARSAVIASIWVGGCLFHGGLIGFVKLFDKSYGTVWSLPISLAVMTALTLLVLRLPAAHVRAAHLALTGAALVMVLVPGAKTAAFEWRNQAAYLAYDADAAAAEMPEIAAGLSSSDQRPPDIYYFIFDRFASPEILLRHYGVDVFGTRSFLEQRGFHVVPVAHSNYHRTAYSLASTFYMDYLDFLAENDRLEGNDWRPLHAMLGDHRVARFLKARGYRFIQFGSWWTGTFHNPVADENHPYGFSEFNLLYLRYTILHPIFQVLPATRFTRRLDWDNAQCQRVGPQIEQIKNLGEQDQPLFVFAHILVPHGPYNFAEDGRCLTREEAEARGEHQGYIDQVIYATRIMEELVTALQAEGRNPPIIIIQADEGPFPEGSWDAPWHEASPHIQMIKTSIINAYYFPNGDYSQLREDITPVNSFRALFNTYFGTNFPLLRDRIFVSPDEKRLYEFHDVTEAVRTESRRSIMSGDWASINAGPIGDRSNQTGL